MEKRSWEKYISMFDDDDEILAVLIAQKSSKQRAPPIFRKRWDSEYMRTLAITESNPLI